MKEVIFYCKGCRYWKQQDKEEYGECTKERLVIACGRCVNLDELENVAADSEEPEEG